MPTYEYRCPEGHEFEKFQRMSDPPEAGCPECGQTAERMLSGGAGLLFKGEGFYITDYRSDSYRKAAEKDKGSTSKSESSESKSGSESKPGSEGGAKSASKADAKSGSGSGSKGGSSAGSSDKKTGSKE